MIDDALTKKASRIEAALRRSGRILEAEMHRLVAIKTGELDRSITTSEVKTSPTTKSIEVGSFDNHYARFVENSSTVKNYHRDGEVVYTGKGQKFVERSLKNKKQDVINEISKAFR